MRRRQPAIGENGATVVEVVHRRERRWHKPVAITVGALVLLAVAGKQFTDGIPSLHDLRPKVEREIKPGLSSVIALELNKKKEFRGDTKKYAVTAELTKKETIDFGPVSKTKQDTGFISTTGTAEGVIDFLGISASSVEVSPDNKWVKITLPHAKADNVVASHRPEDVHITDDPNGWCRVSLNCNRVTEIELLAEADKRLGQAVAKDTDVLTTAEAQATDFLRGFINAFAVPMLYNQDPVHAPSIIDVQVAFGNAAATDYSRSVLPAVAQGHGG